MEAKKNPKVDLRKHTVLFLEIGFVVALSAVLGAFSYTVHDKNMLGLGEIGDMYFDEDIIPITRQMEVTPPPPPAAPKIAEVISIVESDADLDEEFEIEDVEASQDTKVVLFDWINDEEEEEEEVPFALAEITPEFPGGEAALQKYIASHVQYPSIARENSIQGKVYVQFVINKKGEVENVSVARGVDAALDKEAIRVIQGLPNWKPGMQRGKPVRVFYTVPINFKLN